MSRFLPGPPGADSHELIVQPSTYQRLGALFVQSPSFTIHSRQGEANSLTKQARLASRGFVMTFDTHPPSDPGPLDIPHRTAYGNRLSSYPKWTDWSPTCSQCQSQHTAVRISAQIFKSLALCDRNCTCIYVCIVAAVFHTCRLQVSVFQNT